MSDEPSESETSPVSVKTIDTSGVTSESKTSPVSAETIKTSDVTSESKTSPVSGITNEISDVTVESKTSLVSPKTIEMPDVPSHVTIPVESAQTIEMTDTRLADTSRESCVGMLRNELRLRNFGLSHPTPRLFVSDQWGCPTMFLGWRVTMALYHLAWCLYDWIRVALFIERPGTWPVYLTNWSYLLLTAHTLLAAFVVLKTFPGKGLDGGRILWCIKISWVVYEVAAVAGIMVTLMFFIFLFKGTLPPESAEKHIGNSVYIIVDFCITASPIRLLHAIYPMAYALIYLTFTFIYWAASGVNAKGEPYVYSVLNWDNFKGTLALVVGVVLIAAPLMQAIIWSGYLLRVTIHRRCVRRQHAGTSGGGV